MRFSSTTIGLIAAVLLCIPLAGCATAPGARSFSSEHVQAQTVHTAPAVRSALDGTTEAPGPQEILGVYIPFVGTGLSLRGGLLYDGVSRGPITVPVGPLATTQRDEPCEPTGRWVKEERWVKVED